MVSDSFGVFNVNVPKTSLRGLSSNTSLAAQTGGGIFGKTRRRAPRFCIKNCSECESRQKCAVCKENHTLSEDQTECVAELQQLINETGVTEEVLSQDDNTTQTDGETIKISEEQEKTLEEVVPPQITLVRKGNSQKEETLLGVGSNAAMTSLTSVFCILFLTVV